MWYDGGGNSEDDIISNIPLCARRLDAEIVNWFTEINICRLDLLNSFYCILGQLYGHYSNAPNEISNMIGFCGHVLTESNDDMKPITDTWLREIQTRLEALNE